MRSSDLRSTLGRGKAQCLFGFYLVPGSVYVCSRLCHRALLVTPLQCSTAQSPEPCPTLCESTPVWTLSLQDICQAWAHQSNGCHQEGCQSLGRGLVVTMWLGPHAQWCCKQLGYVSRSGRQQIRTPAHAPAIPGQLHCRQCWLASLALCN